jgi:glutaredoxin
MMNKYILAPIVLGIALVLSGCGENLDEIQPTKDNSEIAFFYSNYCPHCKDVEKFIEDNKIKEKIAFSEWEVSSDKGNAKLMIEKQEECKMGEDEIGKVPLLWTKDKCYLGSDKIIEFFKDKAGIK